MSINTHKQRHKHVSSMDSFLQNLHKYNKKNQQSFSHPILSLFHHCDPSKSRSKSKKKKSQASSISRSKKMIDTVFRPRNPFKQQDCDEIMNKYIKSLKELQIYFETTKNKIGKYMCEKFLTILNQITSSMHTTIQQQIEKKQQQIILKLEKKIRNLENKNKRIEVKLKDSITKLNTNTNLIYKIRMFTDVNVDDIFGRHIMSNNGIGKPGYGKKRETEECQINDSENDSKANLGLYIEDYRGQSSNPQQRQRLRGNYMRQFWNQQLYSLDEHVMISNNPSKIPQKQRNQEK